MQKSVNLIAFLWKLISEEHIVVIIDFPDWVQLKKIHYSLVVLHETSFLRQSSSSTFSHRSIFTDPSTEDLMQLPIANCSEMFM